MSCLGKRQTRSFSDCAASFSNPHLIAQSDEFSRSLKTEQGQYLSGFEAVEALNKATGKLVNGAKIWSK
jgi:hypothetical protein